ncbi:MAG: hypothetical protein IKT09_07975 [Synergistes sp.]|nr:hypothetical protein [Synergistes sp.]
MKNIKFTALLLAVLIIGVLTVFGHGRSATTAPAAADRAAELSEQAAQESLPDARQDSASAAVQPVDKPTPARTDREDISEDGKYNSKDDVARYIKKFGHLPSNYVTKKAARNAGWNGGPLDNYFPGCSIGGDVFRNLEGLLPKAPGRTYRECDIDTAGKRSRGGKRIVYSSDGLIYYTGDHYDSFTLLYGGGE